VSVITGSQKKRRPTAQTCCIAERYRTRSLQQACKNSLQQFSDKHSKTGALSSRNGAPAVKKEASAWH